MSHHSPFPLKWARSWSSWSWKPMCRSPGILYTRSLQGRRKKKNTNQQVIFIQVERGGKSFLKKSHEKQKSKTWTAGKKKHNKMSALLRTVFISSASKQKSVEEIFTFYWVPMILIKESIIYHSDKFTYRASTRRQNLAKTEACLSCARFWS